MPNKTKIAIAAQVNGVGGVEHSLLSFLKHLDTTWYDVTLFVLRNAGGTEDDFFLDVPNPVQTVFLGKPDPKALILRLMKRGKIVSLISFLFRFLDYKRTGHHTFAMHRSMLAQYDAVGEKYDRVIAWALPDSVENVFALEKLRGNQKVMWIHMDVAHYRMPADGEKYVSRFDKIVNVSHACKQSFDRIYPVCKEKSVVVYNFMNTESMKCRAEEPSLIPKDGKFHLVTCGRLSGEKNILFAPEIAEKLVKSGLADFCWYLIGTGMLEETLRAKIKEKQVGDFVVLLGKQTNPFPHVAGADLYVQMSDNESFCLTLAEAQILGVPAVSTDFPAAYEIIAEGKSGIITQKNPQSLYEAIQFLRENPHTLAQMRDYLRKNVFDKEAESVQAVEMLLAE